MIPIQIKLNERFLFYFIFSTTWGQFLHISPISCDLGLPDGYDSCKYIFATDQTDHNRSPCRDLQYIYILALKYTPGLYHPGISRAGGGADHRFLLDGKVWGNAL